MSFGHCSCPDCGTTLRIRDRTFVGRVVPCPECRVALTIELDGGERLVARKPSPDKHRPRSREAATGSGTTTPAALGKRGWLKGLQRAAGSPFVMACALGLAVTVLIAIVMLRPTHRFQTPSRPTRPDEVAVAPIPVDPSMPNADSQRPPVVDVPSPTELTDSPVADAIRPVNAPELPIVSPEPQLPDVDGSNVKPVTAVVVKPNDPPPLAPPTPIDFEVTLKQPLQLFDQSKPVSRRELIDLLEELIGAPIRYDSEELGEQNLDKLVTLKAENTTLAGVLKSILEPAGWMFVTEETQLRLKLKPPQ